MTTASTTIVDESESEQSSTEEEEEVVAIDDKEIQRLEKLAFDGNWMLKIPMAKWNAEQMQAWAFSLQYNDVSKKIMQKTANTTSVLQCKTSQEIMKLMDISAEDAVELFEALQEQKREERQQKMMSSLDLNNNGLKIYSNKWRTKSIQKWMESDTQAWIKSLKIGESEDAIMQSMISTELDGADILNCDSNYDLSKLLDIKPSIASIIYQAAEQRVEDEMSGKISKVTVKNKNGDDSKLNDGYMDDEFRIRNINLDRFPHLKLSPDADIIFAYTDADFISRAMMPCGHSIAAESMYFYIKSCFDKHLQQTQIFCPLKECAKEWDWNLCTEVADMNTKELLRWNTARSRRLAVDFRECPYCKRTCDKSSMNMLGTLRAKCVCGAGIWCWECRRPWLSSSTRICGNTDCNFVQKVNEQLEKCALFTPSANKLSSTLQVPIIRACPNCMTFLYHREEKNGYHACNHVSCISCKPALNFCFICLKPRLNGKWQCVGNPCKVAPRQKFY